MYASLHSSHVSNCHFVPQTRATLTLARTAGRALLTPPAGISARAPLTSVACPARPTHHVSTASVKYAVTLCLGVE